MRTAAYLTLSASCSAILFFLPFGHGESEYSKSIDRQNPFLPDDYHNSKTRSDTTGYPTSRMEILIDSQLSVDPTISRSALDQRKHLDLPTIVNEHNLLPISTKHPSQNDDVLKNRNTVSPDQPGDGILGPLPKELLRKTGTTIAGIAGRDFCILAADTRATMGMTVADKRAEKLHKLTHSCWAAGAGTSADLQHISRICHYTFELLTLQQEHTIGNEPDSNLQKPFPSIPAICNWIREDLYRKQGSCQANLIVGGICPNSKRPYLRAIHPHGSMDQVTFAALGSGGMAAMAVLESNLSTASHQSEVLNDVDVAIDVVLRSIRAGIENDLGSGSQIDLVIFHGNGTVEYLRAAEAEQELAPLETIAEVPNMNSGGVNGFGKVPFKLKPCKIGQVRVPKTKEEVESEWDDFLGL